MLITNATLITWDEPNQILDGQAIYIEGDRILEIGPEDELTLRYPDAERLDAENQYVMPGNICAHTHFYGAFARGLSIPGPAPKDFTEILQKLWWPLDRSLTPEDVRASADVMLIDAIRHGTTTLIDHHASPNAIDGSLDIIAEAVDRSGVRAVLCYEVTDRDGSAKTRAGINENVRFIQRTFHLHVAEHESDEYDSLAKSGMRVVDRLHRHGLLGPQTIVAHGVHIDAREANLLAESGTWVTHQPRSNMNNAVGAASVESLLRIGIPVCLGTDGFSHTMWEEWKTAYLLHKVWHKDPRRMPADSIAEMAVYNNSSLAGSFFTDARLGVLAPGAFADLIFVDYHPHTPLTAANLPWQIVFGFHESMISTTIASGKVLMKDHQVLSMDEAAVTAHARQMAPAVWERYNHQFS
ncbi:MAG: amidohydrolase family protein [Anaerolineales bacterium]